ncbi:hypothetical protein K469DRAFT_694434 [Zopfia rhizophila CBS 207.26]|uniref:Uncharacterized protein n=1 Tax=Zopfia rhizophila CBS 207.26 TaxID=1314779 RepID=A0A6A6ENH1_9PEZI|nr:hypothetical protein K469DRAFT_694434 [Zopfia rhizophila CBS 207.26]
MAPVRRYLRITKHSVLEVRIYLDRPSDAEAWLLRRDNPALPRVIQAVRPLVLPKLREENERAKGRGGAKARKKGVKDVVIEDDFEVSIFLTELSSRHSVLTKQKIFKDRSRIQSNSGKLTSWLTRATSEHPMVIPEGNNEPITLQEEDEDELIHLDDIPEAGGDNGRSRTSGRNKCRRGNATEDSASEPSDSDDSFQFEQAPSTKRSRRDKRRFDDANLDAGAKEAQYDKKKLGLNTSYDGFSIYGRVLCLVVKRKGARSTAGGSAVPVSSQQMLENWVSTQAAVEQGDDDDDNG